jgi:3-dehydroquinate dehydratase II
MIIQIINGPNLNLLGKRETGIYGEKPFDVYLEQLRIEFEDVEIGYFQSNTEGELIDEIQLVGYSCDAIVINPGGYSHTSVSIADALKAVTARVVEVHLSQLFTREEYRRNLITATAAGGFIAGFGLEGYRLAILGLLNHPL